MPLSCLDIIICLKFNFKSNLSALLFYLPYIYLPRCFLFVSDCLVFKWCNVIYKIQYFRIETIQENINRVRSLI